MGTSSKQKKKMFHNYRFLFNEGNKYKVCVVEPPFKGLKKGNTKWLLKRRFRLLIAHYRFKYLPGKR